MRPRVAAFFIVTFFLGFPLAGLVFVWKYAHSKIEDSAQPFAQAMANDILPHWDARLLDDLGTLELRKSKAEAEFVSNQRVLGNYVGTSDWRVVKSSVGEREGEVWQFVYCSCRVKYERGEARLDVTIARRSTSREWRIESFRLVR